MHGIGQMVVHVEVWYVGVLILLNLNLIDNAHVLESDFWKHNWDNSTWEQGQQREVDGHHACLPGMHTTQVKSIKISLKKQCS